MPGDAITQLIMRLHEAGDVEGVRAINCLHDKFVSSEKTITDLKNSLLRIKESMDERSRILHWMAWQKNIEGVHEIYKHWDWGRLWELEGDPESYPDVIQWDKARDKSREN